MNYTLQWLSGVPYLSALPSANIQVIDEYLTKVPNFAEGSAHLTSGTVSLDGGASLVFWVKGGFRADSALITIPVAKSITIQSGGSLVADSGSTLSIAGSTSVTGDVDFSIGTTSFLVGSSCEVFSDAFQFLQGSFLSFNGAPGDLAQLNMQADSRLFLSSGGLLELETGALFKLKSGSTATIKSGAFFVVESDDFTVLGGQITVDGSGAPVSELLATGANAAIVVENSAALSVSGASFALSSSATFSLASSCTTTDASTTTRSGPELLSGPDATTAYRQVYPTNASQTLTVQYGDTFYCPTGVGANITYILAQPSPIRSVRAWFKRKLAGSEPGDVTLSTHGGPTPIVKFNQGNSTEAGAMVEYNIAAGRWEALSWCGNVGGTIPGQPL